jgi:hypothetical protein
MKERQELRTECCGAPIRPDQRFCPKCGWEARVEEPDEYCDLQSMRE